MTSLQVTQITNTDVMYYGYVVDRNVGFSLEKNRSAWVKWDEILYAFAHTRDIKDYMVTNLPPLWGRLDVITLMGALAVNGRVIRFSGERLKLDFNPTAPQKAGADNIDWSIRWEETRPVANTIHLLLQECSLQELGHLCFVANLSKLPSLSFAIANPVKSNMLRLVNEIVRLCKGDPTADTKYLLEATIKVQLDSMYFSTLDALPDYLIDELKVYFTNYAINYQNYPSRGDILRVLHKTFDPVTLLRAVKRIYYSHVPVTPPKYFKGDWT